MAVILTDYENYGKKTFYVLWFNIRNEHNICNVFSYGSISYMVMVYSRRQRIYGVEKESWDE